MKVLHILNELKHSGAEVMLRSAYARFSENGIESHILSTGQTPGNYAVYLEQTGFTIHHIAFRKSPMFLTALLAFFRQEQFDAIHIHTERGFLWYVLLAKLSGTKSIVRTYHNVFLFSGYLRWKRQLQRKIATIFCGAVHTAIGESVRAFERERFNNECVLVKNWIDVERFRPPTEPERNNARMLYGLRSEDFAIATIGECSTVKNHTALLKALKKASEGAGSHNFFLLHIGTGPTFDEEHAYVQRHKVEKRCRFLGQLEDVRTCLHAADVFVMTSKWEGLGMAAVEAMSAGLPTILYDVHGLRDLVHEGKGGLLINPDEDSLLAALLGIQKDPQLRKKLAAQAREIAIGAYSSTSSVDQLSRLYRNNWVEANMKH